MIPKKEGLKDQQAENYSDTIPFMDRYFVQMEPIKLTPREFCRKAYRLSELSEVEILKAEIHPQYRLRCINLLSRTLSVSRQSILNWGKGLDFPHMPQHHQKFLGLYWERYELHMEIKKLKRYSA